MIVSASLILQLAVATPAGAAVVQGVVRDSFRGSPIAGAVVTVDETSRSAISNSRGEYRLVDVPAGPQHLDLQSAGYASRRIHLLVPTRGVIQLNVGLEPEPLAIGGLLVEPRIGSPVEGASDAMADPDVGVTRSLAWNHPLLAEPDFLAATLGGDVATMPESPGGLHIRGGSTDQVAYLLNGIPVFSPYHAAGLFSALTPDVLSSVEVRATSPPSWAPDALSGVVLAETLPPPQALSVGGAASTRQLRLSVGTPLSADKSGVVLAGRLGFPGAPNPDVDPGFLHGDGSDWTATLEHPLAGGDLRLLLFSNSNSLNTAGASGADSQDESNSAPGVRNRFGWGGTSVGFEFDRPTNDRKRVTARGWRSTGDASVDWSTGMSMRAVRVDHGAQLLLHTATPESRTTTGLEVRRSAPSYRTLPPSGTVPALDLGVVNATAVASVDRWQELGGPFSIDAGLRATLFRRRVRASPRLGLRWAPDAKVSVATSFTLRHQYEQSLRNDQTLFAALFPADLYVGADESLVPVAEAKEVTLTALYRPYPGTSVRADVFRRNLSRILLPALQSVLPFTEGDFSIGSGSIAGASITASHSSARHVLLAVVGLQRTRYAYEDAVYTPDFAAARSLQVGVTVFPSATISLRLGAIGLFGRRTTAVGGPVDWQTCSLDNRGCQIGGSPSWRPEALGATGLPPYLRVDAGIRKHWDVALVGRRGLLAAYGSVTNLFDRGNVQTLVVAPVTGVREPLIMQGRGPLVIGLEWRF